MWCWLGNDLKICVGADYEISSTLVNACSGECTYLYHIFSFSYRIPMMSIEYIIQYIYNSFDLAVVLRECV